MMTKLATCALAVGFGLPLAAATAPAQVLTIRVHGDGAQATRLAQYDPNVPIAVTVEESGGLRLDGVTISAAGPAGESIRAPLTRGSDGEFHGSLTLGDQGAWRLRLTSQVAKIATESTPVSVDVMAPPPSNAWLVGLGVGVAIFVFVGGSGFVILRHTIGAPVEGARVEAA